MGLRTEGRARLVSETPGSHLHIFCGVINYGPLGISRAP